MNKVVIAKLIEKEEGVELNVDFNDVNGNEAVMIISGLVMKLSEQTNIPTEFIQRDITLFVAQNKLVEQSKAEQTEDEKEDDV